MSYLEKVNLKYEDKHVSIKEINDHYTKYLTIEQDNIILCIGWIQSIRKQSTNTFIQLYDGSCSINLQIVFSSEILGDIQLHPGTTISVIGILVKSPAKGQIYEMQGKEVRVLGNIEEPSIYLPCIKGVKIENLRTKYTHLRSKFQSMRAIFRIRHCLIQALHSFFNKHNCFQLDPNIITTSDCEGAGETFLITTQIKNDKENINVDFSKDFFRKQAYLTVSSQLHLEALCSGMGKVYTMNPSFRAEPSQTNRHVACFTHVEWELAFIDFTQLLDFNEDIIKYSIAYLLDKNMDDLEILDKFVSKGIIDKLKGVVNCEFERLTYTDALTILEQNLDKLKQKYKDFELPKWGDDLGSNCERFLCEVVYNKPILVYNYPKVLKSFYMKQNDDKEEFRTVQSCDVLIPGVGEVIGSSMREDNYDKLLSVMKEKNMKLEPLEWYMDLRRNSTFPHGGAGLGFDRLVSYCTFMEGSIRDVIPFPVAYELCEY